MKYFFSIFFFVSAIIYALGAILSVEQKYVDAPYKLGDKGFVQERTHEALIRLHDKKGRFFCSGFVVDAGYAITAGHCAKAVKEIKIFDSKLKDTGIVATSAGFDERTDQGLIKGDFSSFQNYEVDFYDQGIIPNFLHIYVSCGWPYGAKQTYCTYITPVVSEDFGMRILGFLLPGCSGGPVIDQSTGKVVGINSRASKSEGFVIAPILGLSANFGVEP